jgi:hypothetical protein
MVEYPPTSKPDVGLLSKSKHGESLLAATWDATNGKFSASFCPYGKPGDRLYVRETFGVADSWLFGGEPTDPPRCIAYSADHAARCFDPEYDVNTSDWGWENMKWKPSIHMPRWASRILLEITDVRVERLNDISEIDSLAEGIERSSWEYSCEPYRNYRKPRMAPGENCSNPRTSFMTLWESINGHNSWGANPWVWVIKFKVIKP